MKKRLPWLLGYLILIPSLVLNLYLFLKTRKPEGEKIRDVVEAVIDGDSLVLSSQQRVRLGNLEAPELENCGGQEAKERLTEMTEGKKIEYQIIGVDQFNRPLVMVFAGNDLVNEIILREGWARYDGTPSPYRDTLKEAYDYALENKVGIFSPVCFSEKPENPDCLIKGNADRHSSQKIYHFPGCSGYPQVMVEKDLGEDWFCSEAEAEKAGFVKSQNCFGKKYSLPGKES